MFAVIEIVATTVFVERGIAIERDHAALVPLQLIGDFQHVPGVGHGGRVRKALMVTDDCVKGLAQGLWR